MTASTQYAEHRKDIDALIGWLTDELDRHEAEAKSDPANWGFAGDLAEVRRQLKDALGFISETDGKDIEKALADLRA